MNTSSSPKTKNSVRLKPSPWDAAVILIVFALAGSLFFFFLSKGASDTATTCTISQNGTVLDSFSIAETASLEERTYGDYTLHFSSGHVCIESAPCGNQDCVHTGYIHRAGQSIVCLPGRFIVELTSSDKEDLPFDIIVK